MKGESDQFLLEEFEDRQLSPLALSNRDHTERIHPEPAPPFRTAFQRDRDRIIHSKAFRRLGYKTQVFVNSEGDNYRTRLTHSIEVGQIARSAAAALKLNRDYAEALALAHDLGHTPFGHAGQEQLHDLMLEYGGFEHNCQSLRIVSTLETRYLEFTGLNLTRATLKGMMKHANTYECDTPLKPLVAERMVESPPLEARLVDVCDRIAYIHHDLEDGLDSDIITLELLDEVAPWRDSLKAAEKRGGDLFRRTRDKVRVRTVIRGLINRCITDLIENSKLNLERLELKDFREVKGLKPNDYPIAFSAEMSDVTRVFSQFLKSQLYRNPRVVEMSARGQQIIENLFKSYMESPTLIPKHYQSRIVVEGKARVVCDYIAGMTDRFALKEGGENIIV